MATAIKWADRPENKAARLEYMKDWRRANPVRACVHSMVGGARDRARRAGTPIDLEYLTVANVWKLLPADMACECCGETMVAEVENGKHPRAVSLDRVDNRRGYVRGNVAVICSTCNVRKRDMSEDDLRQLLAYIESYGI